MNSLRKKPVTAQVATETPYHQITLSFNAERSKVAEEINKMLKDLHKGNLPKMDKTGKGEV